MFEILTFATLGFILGMRHAMDADHVAAVSALVSRKKSSQSATSLGLFWGLGHSVTIMGVGFAIIAFKLAISEALAQRLEFFVGVMLAALGALNLSGSAKPHSHAHGEQEHTHDHGHEFDFWKNRRDAPGFWAFCVGIVHGLAGSAALSLLVVAAIPTLGGAMAYLGVFGIGTMVGMAALSAFMGWALESASDSSARFGLAFQAAAGLASLGLGFYIMYHNWGGI